VVFSFFFFVFVELFFVTPRMIWVQHDLRVRFAYLEEKEKLSRKRRACILGSCQAEIDNRLGLSMLGYFG